MYVHNNGMPKEGSQRICLSVILNDSVFNIGKKLLFIRVFRKMQMHCQGKRR